MKKLKLLFILCFTLNICNGQWVKLSSDTVHYYSTIDFINSDTGFIAGIDWYNSNYVGVILRTMDGGDTWDTTRLDPGFWIMNIQFINDTLGMAIGQDGIMVKTTNTGDSWYYTGDCTVPFDVGQFWFINQDTGFYQNFGGGLLKTNSWTIDSICFPTGFNGFNSYFPGTGALRFIDTQNGYVAGGNGHFSRTIDGGNSWLSYNGDSSISILSAWMTDINNIVITGENGKVSVSQNGGVTWSPTFSISSHPILDVMLKDSSFGYAVGGADEFYHGPSNLAPRGIIWKTLDGGYSWTVEDSSWFDQLTAVSIVNDSLAFAVGYRGLILRNSNPLFSNISDPKIQSTIINVFPNPISDQLNVQVDNTAISEIILFDIASRILFRKQFTNKISLNTSQLVKGMYFYEISNKKGILKNGNVIKM